LGGLSVPRVRTDLGVPIVGEDLPDDTNDPSRRKRSRMTLGSRNSCAECSQRNCSVDISLVSGIRMEGKLTCCGDLRQPWSGQRQMSGSSYEVFEEKDESCMRWKYFRSHHPGMTPCRLELVDDLLHPSSFLPSFLPLSYVSIFRIFRSIRDPKYKQPH